MKIYTGRGDRGFTQGPSGEKLRKYDLRVEAPGAVDELSSYIGWALQAENVRKQLPLKAVLKVVQKELFALNALLAAAGTGVSPSVSLDDNSVERMEREIDAASEELPPLEHFILPGGCELACRLHIARTVCRRAERVVAGAAGVETRIPPLAHKYLNRLGDFLFVAARQANVAAGMKDEIWQGDGIQ